MSWTASNECEKLLPIRDYIESTAPLETDIHISVASESAHQVPNYHTTLLILLKKHAKTQLHVWNWISIALQDTERADASKQMYLSSAMQTINASKTLVLRVCFITFVERYQTISMPQPAQPAISHAVAFTTVCTRSVQRLRKSRGTTSRSLVAQTSVLSNN